MKKPQLQHFPIDDLLPYARNPLGDQRVKRAFDLWDVATERLRPVIDQALKINFLEVGQLGFHGYSPG